MELIKNNDMRPAKSNAKLQKTTIQSQKTTIQSQQKITIWG